MTRIGLKDYGGHAEIIMDGEVIGYINYAHGWHRDFGKQAQGIPEGYVYSAMITLQPRYRGRGLGTEAFKQFIELEKAKGEKVIAGWPLTPDSERFMVKLGFRRGSKYDKEAYLRYGHLGSTVFELPLE